MLNNRNISVSLVKESLGECTNDVSALCTSSRINPWSKYKPVTSEDPVFDILSDQKGERNYNVIFERVNSIQEAVETLRGNILPSVAYEKIPSGYPKRLGDFRFYEPSATQPLNETMIDRVYNKLDPASNIVFRNKVGLAQHNLTYNEILPSYHFALCVLDVYGDFVSMVTSLPPISKPSGNELNLYPGNDVYLTNIDYTCYPMLINKEEPYTIQTSQGGIISDDFVLLPVKPFSMKVLSSVELTLIMEVSGFNEATGEFIFEIFYTNKSGKDIVVDSFDMEIIGEEWDEEIGAWVSFIADRWTDYTGAILTDNTVHGETRVGGQLSILDYKGQANYTITAHANTRNLVQVTDGVAPIQ